VTKKISIPGVLVLLTGGILIGAVVVYSLTLSRPQPSHPPKPEIVEIFEDAKTLTPAITSTTFPSATAMPTMLPTLTPTITSTTTPTEKPLNWRGADLGSGDLTVVKFLLNDCIEDIYTEPFHPWAFFGGIFDTAFFNPYRNGAVAWEDFEGRIILWIHSGPNLTITSLQVFLELDHRGYINTPEETQRKLDECVIGSAFELVQDNLLFTGKVVAAARIPPPDVLDLNDNVWDLPQALMEKGLGQDWQAIIDDPHSLIFFFCGRRLSGEASNPYLPYYQQSRFVIGMVPAD